MKLRVGIVGLGATWESRYRPALRALADRFEVRGVCEQVAHLASRAAADLSVTAVDGYRALIQRDDIDAILYLADQWYAAQPIFAACDVGKAVYSAISLPVDVEQTRVLRARVEASGIAFMAELPRRHAPATARLKELIATRLGQPRLLFCHRRVPLGRTAASSPPRDATSESRDLMELVDWCRYVVGSNPTSVIAVRHAGPADNVGDDYHMMSLDFSMQGPPGSGATAQISCGYYMPQQWEEAVSFRPPAALQVACEKGIAFIDLPSSLVWFDSVGRHQESLEHERPVDEQMLLHFHRSVTSLVRQISGLDDTHQAMRVVHAAAESHLEGRRIRLDTEGSV